MTTVTRERFLALFRGADRELLRHDPRTAGAELEGLDAAATFTRLDGLDGRRDGVITLTNRVADMFEAVASASPELRALSERRTGSDSGVLVVGMRSTCFAEARALRDRTRVSLITDPDGDESDVVHLPDGHRFDLSNAEQLRQYVWSFGLPTAQAQQIIELLEASELRSRRELGEIARVWSAAEHGREIPRRLMLTGHATADVMFGDSNSDRLDDATLFRLAAILPRAAAQIEHVHVAACQHGYETRMTAFRAAFPNLRSMWGYGGIAPAYPRSVSHELYWESATHDLPRDPRLSRGAALRSLDAGANIAVWTASGGYSGPATREYFDLERELIERRAVYDGYFAGTSVDASPTAGPLFERYRVLNQFTTHIDAFWRMSAADRQRWEDERHTVLCLRYYAGVSRSFARHYAAAITAGYRAVGLAVPNFATLSRAEALASIAQFERAGGNPTLLAVLRDFRDLRRPTIPETWA